YGALIQAQDGYLYGTTQFGGIAIAGSTNGRGTVFRMTLDGTTTTLHNFIGGTSIAFPYSGLLPASNDTLYGTTYAGDPAGNGRIYRIYPVTLGFTILHVFQRASEGAGAVAGLMQAQDGLLYGVTHLGGSTGLGTAFKVPLSGNPVTVVH